MHETLNAVVRNEDAINKHFDEHACLRQVPKVQALLACAKCLDEQDQEGLNKISSHQGETNSKVESSRKKKSGGKIQRPLSQLDLEILEQKSGKKCENLPEKNQLGQSLPDLSFTETNKDHVSEFELLPNFQSNN